MADRSSLMGNDGITRRTIARPTPLDAMGGVLRHAFTPRGDALPADMQALLDRLDR